MKGEIGRKRRIPQELIEVMGICRYCRQREMENFPKGIGQSEVKVNLEFMGEKVAF